MKKILVLLMTKVLKPKLVIHAAILIAGLLSFSQPANAATAYYVSKTDVYVRTHSEGYAMGRLYKANNDRMDIQYVDPNNYAYGYAYGNVNRCVWVKFGELDSGIKYFRTDGAAVSAKCRSTNMYLYQSEFTNGEIWKDPNANDGMPYFLPRATEVWDNWAWDKRWGKQSYRGRSPANSLWRIRYTTSDGGGVMARPCSWTGRWETTTCASDWQFIQRSSVDTIHCGYLNSGEGLGKGQTLNSCDGRFSLTMQTDGNLVLYQSGGGALWATWTTGYTGRNLSAFMQTDGNLVVYADPFWNWIPLWNSGTPGYPNSRLQLQNDGNLVIYNAYNNYTWASNTCCK